MKSNLVFNLAFATSILVGTQLATAAQTATPAPAAQPDPAPKADLAATAADALTVKKTEISNYDFWHLQCDQMSDAKATKKCAARLPIFKANSQQLIAVLVINQDDAKQWQLKMVIPTSISIMEGGTISFDGTAAKPQNFLIESCEPAACASSLPLDANMINTLKGSSKATLTWTALDHSAVKFDFEIKGIQQTVKALFG